MQSIRQFGRWVTLLGCLVFAAFMTAEGAHLHPLASHATAHCALCAVEHTPLRSRTICAPETVLRAVSEVVSRPTSSGTRFVVLTSPIRPPPYGSPS